jgi:hypothetical protein
MKFFTVITLQLVIGSILSIAQVSASEVNAQITGVPARFSSSSTSEPPVIEDLSFDAINEFFEEGQLPQLEEPLSWLAGRCFFAPGEPFESAGAVFVPTPVEPASGKFKLMVGMSVGDNGFFDQLDDDKRKIVTDWTADFNSSTEPTTVVDHAYIHHIELGDNYKFIHRFRQFDGMIIFQEFVNGANNFSCALWLPVK